MSIKVIQPSYYDSFRCVGAECEDSCCRGMGIPIDKETFDKYRECGDPVLRPQFDRFVRKSLLPKSDISYGFISSPSRQCPFWTDEDLCLIQLRLGEEHLSRTCATYPRILNTVDGVMERSLCLSCPESARLILLNPSPMTFVESEPAEPYRFGGFPELNSTGPHPDARPYRRVDDIRRFVVALLQNRTYDVWERLVLLGAFCEQLQSLSDDKEDAAPSLMESYTAGIADRSFDGNLSGIAASAAFHVDFVAKVVESRIESEPVGARFLQSYTDYKIGIELEQAERPEDAAANYQKARDLYFRPFIEEHSYLFENFLVYQAFRTLFPFEPPSSRDPEPRTMFDEYVYIVIGYALVRSLLVGIAGKYKDELSLDHFILLVQSYAREIEHNAPFLKRVRTSLADSHMDSLAALAALVKS